MQILIIGAAGMVGGKLARSLASEPEPGLAGLTLLDVVTPVAPAGAAVPVETGALDLTDAAAVAAGIAERPEVIFHLAAVVSGEAEADFEKGYAVNFDGTRHLLDAIRAQPGYRPRLVFTSSIAVFGAPFPEPIPRHFHLTPLTSYGTQKAMSGTDARRLFAPRLARRHRHPAAHDLHPARRAEQGRLGVLLEHPARAAGRPGGGAAGGRGRAPLASPARAPRWASCATPRRSTPPALGAARGLTMPGLSATVGEQIEALRRVAGDARRCG